MALSWDNDPLRGRPIEVFFKGFRSDTYALQRAGWNIAMEAGSFADLQFRYGGFSFAFHHPALRLGMLGKAELKNRITGMPEFIEIVNVAMKGTSMMIVSNPLELRPIDATPTYAGDTLERRDLFDMPFFQTLHVPQAEPLILEPETVAGLLEKIRQMQAPEQAAIRARNTSRQNAANRIHAHIMSAAA